MESYFCSSICSRLVSVSFGPPSFRTCFNTPFIVSLVWVKRLDILLQAAFTSRSSDVHEGGSGHLAYRSTVDTWQVSGFQKRQEDGSISTKVGPRWHRQCKCYSYLLKTLYIPCRSEGSHTVGRCLCEPFTVMCVTERHCSEWAKYVRVARQ
jgi:hypothetical protein